MEFVVVFLLFGLTALGLGISVYNRTSHSNTKGNTLKEHAIICDIKTESVGGHNAQTAALRTTVTFDDGFVFTSHKSHRMRIDLLNTRLIVTDFILDEIKKDAIAAHQKAYRKQFYS